MIWLVVSLVIILLIVCIILQMKIKHSREQEAEGKQLLEDYQKRVNEMEKLLKDYRSLEQNFDNVGQGYEEALMAFDKMEEEKQKVLKVKEAIEKQSNEVMAAKQKLEETMLKKKNMIEQYAEAIKQKLDYTHPNAGNIALTANQILNVIDIEMEQPLRCEDNVMAQDIAAMAIQESGIQSYQKAEFKCQMVEEAQATMVFTNSKHAVRALVALLDNAMKFTAQGEIGVRDYNGAVLIEGLEVTSDNRIRIVLRNMSDFTIARVNFRIDCYDRDGNPMVCNTDGESTFFEGSYSLALDPGMRSEHGQFNFRNAAISDPLGMVVLTLTRYTDLEGYTWDIPENARVPRNWDWRIQSGWSDNG